ncbi:MAG: hypothetical protein Kow0092_37180 [Deferrisomatales bacterium]
MNKTLLFVALLASLGYGSSAWSGDHPGSDSKCRACHTLGKGPQDAPKVVPEPPGFWARLFGARPYEGHPSVSCAGAAGEDGTVTGCHRPEGGLEDFLVVDPARPSDALCGACHGEQARDGQHHPSYRTDRDGDGVAETVVRAPAGQELYAAYDPLMQAEPLRSHPDALVFEPGPDGTRVLRSVLPTETVVERADGEERRESLVVTCTTCHNPHYGYLVGAGTPEELDRDLVAREKGDALLRLRDYDNALCNGCH